MPKANSTMISTTSYSRRYSLLFALLLFMPFAAPLSSSSNSYPKVRIQVCQNKDCCRRFQGSASLVDTLHDLIPPGMEAAHTTVESTGCLSRCETGPNICVQRDGHPDNVDLQGVENAAAAAMHLQTTCAIDVPSKLIAAVKVMEKAQKASSPEEKERCLSSVIKSLRSDTALAGSLAGTHALVLRASARCEAKNHPAALEDAQEALAALQSQSQERKVNVSWEGQAWRVSADAHQALGNLPAAVEALQEWAVHTPSFRTKALKEIKRLQSI